MCAWQVLLPELYILPSLDLFPRGRVSGGRLTLNNSIVEVGFELAVLLLQPAEYCDCRTKP